MTNNKRKILYVSGTRADYGLMRETLYKIKSNPNLVIEIAVVGMHIMPEFGNTIDEIKKDGFKIHKIGVKYEKDDKESMAIFIGKTIQLMTKEVNKINPDIILLLGDRSEMLAGAIVGAYMSIPVAHIHGGDVTGTIDDLARNAITKLSSVHFAATKNSAERIKKMGGDPSKIFFVGAPGLCEILNEKLISKTEIIKKYNLDLKAPLILLIQHSVSAEIGNTEKQIKETMEAVRELGLNTIIIYPNADAGGRKIISIIKKYNKYSFIKIYKNISRNDYLSLMNIASVMVGNSSSGIIEAPSFKLPVINIGTREKGREKTGNVIDVDYKKEQIIKAVKKAIYSKEFLNKLQNLSSPYGDGKAGERISNILSVIKINSK